MENALDKLDDLEYELEKAYEWLDDHKGDKRKSCSSRKKVCMLQKACERLRDAYEDEFEEESSDEDDDGWVCMESLVHQVGIPKMKEKETKKEAGQKSLEEPLDNLILPLECAHGVKEEYPLLKITPILSNERMEIGIWREDLNSQESKKGTPHNLILTPTTIDAIDVSCLNEEDFSKEHAILFHKAHEMLIYPLISYGVLLEAILCDGMCISIHTMNYWKHDGACLPIHATTLYLNHARIMMSNFAQRLDGKIWFYLIDYHDGITQWFFLLLCLEGNCLWYFILKVSLKDDDGFLWMAQCIVKMDVFEACYVKANDFLEVEAYARHGDVEDLRKHPAGNPPIFKTKDIRHSPALRDDLLKAEELDKIITVLHRMEKTDCNLDMYTYTSLLDNLVKVIETNKALVVLIEMEKSVREIMLEARQPRELPLMRELSSLQWLRLLRDPNMKSNAGRGSSRTPSWKSPIFKTKDIRHSPAFRTKEVRNDQFNKSKIRDTRDGKSPVFHVKPPLRRVGLSHHAVPSPFSDPVHAYGSERAWNLEMTAKSPLHGVHIKRRQSLEAHRVEVLHQQRSSRNHHDDEFSLDGWRDPSWGSDMEILQNLKNNSDKRLKSLCRLID
ncbi:hypothetical protein L7F22_013300 [Adiantum nelumboides]|nr:hypothetical protein [Adiantum nelumboides]